MDGMDGMDRMDETDGRGLRVGLSWRNAHLNDVPGRRAARRGLERRTVSRATKRSRRRRSSDIHARAGRLARGLLQSTSETSSACVPGPWYDRRRCADSERPTVGAGCPARLRQTVCLG